MSVASRDTHKGVTFMLNTTQQRFARCRSLALAALVAQGGTPCWTADSPTVTASRETQLLDAMSPQLRTHLLTLLEHLSDDPAPLLAGSRSGAPVTAKRSPAVASGMHPPLRSGCCVRRGSAGRSRLA